MDNFVCFSSRVKKPGFTSIHVHVSHPDGEAKFWLSPTVALANKTGLSVRQLHQAQTIVETHIKEIQDVWNQHFPS